MFINSFESMFLPTKRQGLNYYDDIDIVDNHNANLYGFERRIKLEEGQTFDFGSPHIISVRIFNSMLCGNETLVT